MGEGGMGISGVKGLGGPEEKGGIVRAGPRKGRFDIFGCVASVSSSSLTEEGEEIGDSEENEVLLLEDGEEEVEEEGDVRGGTETDSSMEGMGGNASTEEMYGGGAGG